jgi:SAM-dependent methyltransferase
MGDLNQLRFIQQHLAHLRGPYLEVGSKDYGSTQDLRPLVGRDTQYVGVDLEAGPGVDVVLDLAGDFPAVDAGLGGRRFGTIFCLSVLEHCRQPFAMAENLTRLLVPGGRLCVSVPFAWKFHGYPSDYWRFTPEGVKLLFPRLVFTPEECVWATSREGDIHKLDEGPEVLGKISFGSKACFREGRFLKGVSMILLRLLAGVGLFGWLRGYRYVLAPTSVMMIGTLGEPLPNAPTGY